MDITQALPLDLIVACLRLLPLLSIARAARVSKAWRDACRDETLWASLYRRRAWATFQPTTEPGTWRSLYKMALKDSQCSRVRVACSMEPVGVGADGRQVRDNAAICGGKAYPFDDVIDAGARVDSLRLLGGRLAENVLRGHDSAMVLYPWPGVQDHVVDMLDHTFLLLETGVACSDGALSLRVSSVEDSKGITDLVARTRISAPKMRRRTEIAIEDGETLARVFRKCMASRATPKQTMVPTSEGYMIFTIAVDRAVPNGRTRRAVLNVFILAWDHPLGSEEATFWTTLNEAAASIGRGGCSSILQSRVVRAAPEAFVSPSGQILVLCSIPNRWNNEGARIVLRRCSEVHRAHKAARAADPPSSAKLAKDSRSVVACN